MAEAVRIDEEQFGIVTDTERASAPLRVLKHGDSFCVFGPMGDMASAEAGEEGLFHDGTRYVSRLELRIAGRRPLLLSSTIGEDNTVFTADLTNPDLRRGEHVVLPHGVIHLFRSRVLWNGRCVERIRMANHALTPVEVSLSIRVDADFADIFEVRGTHRARRGERLPDFWGEECLLRYLGLDRVERRMRLQSSRPPDAVEPGLLTFVLSLDRQASITIDLTMACEQESERPAPGGYDEVLHRSKARVAAHAERACELHSSSEVFNLWVRRSASDLRMMLTETAHGVYPYAGIPWFSTPFGRDGLITALELLWADPEVARGVLSFLADTQATTISDAQDAQPGKIVHEMRSGEMAALGEVPFGRYYGSADATPLFVMLADAWFARTGDLTLIERLWPHILAALAWMETWGDVDGDGFIEYARRHDTGLAQQGWKDSHDSVFHADGSMAAPPIALCEIQGYAYGAWIGASRLAGARGDSRSAAAWREQADRLAERFDAAFWCDEIGTYALALDGQKRQCRVRSSNAGHALFTGIARADRAAQIAATLLSDTSFDGWGIRTIAAGESRYNPMSYHNGSIWPHDNAIVAAGLARYGFTQGATRIMHAMLDLSQAVDVNRLPELICGFHRRRGEQPTLYPVACAPQSWAAGAVYLLLEACLGLRVEAAARRVTFHRGVLPEAIDHLRISRLAVGEGSVDLLLQRHPHDIGVEVLRREGDVEIVSVK